MCRKVCSQFHNLQSFNKKRNESRGCSIEQEYNDNTRGHYPVELNQPMNRMCICLRKLTVCWHMLGISSNWNMQVSVRITPLSVFTPTDPTGFGLCFSLENSKGNYIV